MVKVVKRINLSQHTLDISTRGVDTGKFDFEEIEDYVTELANGRKYQYEAIKNIMTYLWSGKYKTVQDLAKQNYQKKEEIQLRFPTEEYFLNMMPLPDRLSGVCHMATGTGKSYVIFAIAYLSIILGKVKRVLVLGPSSTVIEQGLTDKFKEYLFGEKGIELKEKLPERYRNIKVEIKNSNEPIEDNCIVIENINAVYGKENNSIGDTLFNQNEEVLVLSDEVHHAYSHLDFSKPILTYDFEEGKEGTGENRDERLWMKFIREEKKIKRHIGFTGTPYNQNEYFTDVIFNYSIKDAVEEKYIKKINPIIHTESDEGDIDITKEQKYEQILMTHFDNKEKYNYGGKVKPITIFINNTQATATRNRDEFVKSLAAYLRKNLPEYKEMTVSQLESIAHKKTILVIANNDSKEYKDQLDKIEETDSSKTGGEVEFIFAVNKLSEGWDVDNVFQIVPTEEKVFNSKLLISQVLGRGLRIPRKISDVERDQIYPLVTVTNHEKFASYIEEIFNQVTDCDITITSKVYASEVESERAKYNFDLFNINYLSTEKTVEKEDTEYTVNRTLVLNPQPEKLHLRVEYISGLKDFSLTKEFVSLDEVVAGVYRKFQNVILESRIFEENKELGEDDLFNKDRIREIILNAMQDAGIKNEKLSRENKKVIELYFNQFLPRGRKNILRERIEGDLIKMNTMDLRKSTTRLGSLDFNTSVFVSEDWEEKLDEENKIVLQELIKANKQISIEQTGSFTSVDAIYNKDVITTLIPNKRIYTVKSEYFKSPQNLIIANHDPERDFVFQLFGLGEYIDGWVKSPDSDFYSIDYEYWKAGKDRTMRAFNPDFFIKLNLTNYISKVQSAGGNTDKLTKLQDKGVEEIIYVIEIKSEDDRDEITNAKDEAGKSHFKGVNKKLEEVNPLNYQNANLRQYYIFELLRPDSYGIWGSQIRYGNLKI
ncbi:MAG TPA: DEAD/DEAH box helicase family protein [Candidatus Dojkabacteria bacterium]|nr:DEAD/DEAH box helicase family protein [Candidatus Dojkabacteria bacterium]